MRLSLWSACLLVVSASASFAQTSQTPQPSSRFSIDNIDKSTDPCVDFYQYACGNWMKTAQLPADRPGWDSFGEVEEQNLAVLRTILEKAAAASANRDPVN